MTKDPIQNIGSGPHDPDPPPPPDAVLDALRAGATWENGTLQVAGDAGTVSPRWLHIAREGWVLRDWKDAAHGCGLTRATFDALAQLAATKASWTVFGQHLGLVPRAVHGRLVAELTVVGSAPASPL